MIAPRLSEQEVLTTGRVLSPMEANAGDPRLANQGSFWSWAMVVMSHLVNDGRPSMFLVEWPDTSMGYVSAYQDEPRRTNAILEGYGWARKQLESLELDRFTLCDTPHPQ
jgi:hypothetical protein